MLYQSALQSLVLSVKIIVLISAIIVVMDLIRASSFVKRQMERVNTLFSILVGQLLGITYGAAILVREVRQGSLSQRDIFFISTFLMICHSIIEDILLFVIFGANFWVIFSTRIMAAVLLSSILAFITTKLNVLDRIIRT